MRTRLLLCALATATACGADTTGPGVPATLTFTVQPSSVLCASGLIRPAVQVAVQDRQGHTVESATTSIAVAITSATGTSGAALAGTLTVAAVGGVATFDDLAVDKAGQGYTLTATATGLPSATSGAFDVFGPCLPPLAGLRYLNLVNDTGAVDFRIVNLVGYAPSASAAAFRTGGSPYGLPADSLPNHLAVSANTSVRIRVSPNSTDPIVAAQILFDTTLVFTVGVNYTFYLYGQARGAHVRALVTADTLASPAGAAFRVVNLGGAGVGPTDVDIVPQTAVAPLTGTAMFANVAHGAVTGYVNLAVNPAYEAVATAPSTRAPFLFVANVPAGRVGTPNVNPIAGSGVAGTGISVVIAPRPVANSGAQSGCGTPAGCLASDTLPRLLFLIDKKPPPTAP